MAKTANEEWFDANVRHQIFLLIFAGSLTAELLALLNASEADVARVVRSGLVDTRGLNAASVKKSAAVFKRLQRVRGAAWDKLEERVLDAFDDLAKREPEFLQRTLRAILPVEASVAKASVSKLPFQGRTLRGWLKDLRTTDGDHMMRAITIGLSNNESSADIARRIVGSSSVRGTNGTTQATRLAVEGLVRTATTHIGDQARQEFVLANQDLFSQELFVATLDSRTTATCRALDGKLFAFDEGPRPPLHWKCRSMRISALNGYALGNRPAKPFTEQELLREFARREGIPPPDRRANLPYGMKGPYDKFHRLRVRELTGTVPSKVSFQDWISGQSAQFQDDVLGKTRARLFRRGGLKLDRFVDRQWREIPLSQLADMERQAFIKAGLDPDAF